MSKQEALNELKREISVKGHMSKFQERCFEILEADLKNPTEEDVFKEFEELGYEWWEYKDKNVFELCKYDKTNGLFLGKIEIDLEDKEYWSDITFTMKEHQLLHRLFEIWGWL